MGGGGAFKPLPPSWGHLSTAADSWPCARNVTVGVRYRQVNAMLQIVSVRDSNVSDEGQRKSPQCGAPWETACCFRRVEMAMVVFTA